MAALKEQSEERNRFLQVVTGCVQVVVMELQLGWF